MVEPVDSHAGLRDRSNVRWQFTIHFCCPVQWFLQLLHFTMGLLTLSFFHIFFLNARCENICVSTQIHAAGVCGLSETHTFTKQCVLLKRQTRFQPVGGGSSEGPSQNASVFNVSVFSFTISRFDMPLRFWGDLVFMIGFLG